jgi:hypothetical protein
MGLFNANWTEAEDGGRATKRTARPLSDPSRPLTSARALNRISARISAPVVAPRQRSLLTVQRFSLRFYFMTHLGAGIRFQVAVWTTIDESEARRQ